MPIDPQTETSNIFYILAQNKKRILSISLLAAALGLIISLIRTKEYTAETAFVLKNHLFADRTYLYSKDMRYINYYAPEDDIERLVALTDADNVMEKLITDLNLITYYKVDIADPIALRQLKKKIAKKVKISRTPEKHALLAYKDKDPEMAANIANKYLELIEANLHYNYNKVRADVHHSLENKILEEDALLNQLSDSLAKLRTYYRIYDIINPTRGNMIMNFHIEDNGHPEFAKGLELIQNLESVKDRIVADRSDHVSLANQYTGSDKVGDLSLVQMIKTAQPPLKPSSMGVVVTTLLCFIIGLGFSVFYVLIFSRPRGRNQRF